MEKDALGHEEVAHDAKAPTCTEKGWDAYVTCSRCDYTTKVEKDALGHTEVVDPAVDATCTEPGKTAGTKCSVCGEVITAGTVIPATGHTYDENGECENCDASCAFTVNGAYFETLAEAVAAAEDGATITVLKSVEISKTSLGGKKLTIEGANSGVVVTKAGEFDGTNYAKIDDYMLELGSGSNVTFKNITFKSARIINIIANESGKTVTITLDAGTTFEATPNRELWKVTASDGKISYSDAGLIYKNTTNVDVTINVNAGATMLVPATETVNNPLVFLNNAAKGTLNVYGTMKNLATVGEGKNAQIFVAKQSCNAFFNVYDGAVIEGTSDSVANTGNYSGIVYYSAATLNGINISGGTITIHGRTGLAYTGTKCDIAISGNAVINNVDAAYPMFYGAAPVATLTGTDTVKPTINTPKALMGKGSATAVNYFTVENHAPLAKTLGFAVLLASKNTAYTNMSTARDAAAAEDTYYLLSDVSTSTSFAASFFTNRKLTITSYGDAKYTWTTSNGAAGVLFYLGNNSHLVIDNVIMNVGCRILRFESDGDVGGYTKLDIMGGAEIYALPAGDGNFFYYSANRVLTMNIEEGAIIQRKGDDTHTTSHLINLGDSFAAGSVINIKGKLSDISNFTGTSGTRSGNLFYVGTANVTVNVYATAEFEAAATKTTTTRFSASGAVYFKGYANAEDYDAAAKSFGYALRMSETAGDNAAYVPNLNVAVNTIPAGGEGTICIISKFSYTGGPTFENKNVTIVGAVDGVDMEYTGSGYMFGINNMATLTFRNVNISITNSGGLAVYFPASSSVAQADRDIVINLVNTTVDVSGSSTALISSYDHYGSDATKKSDSVTFNVDADSVINFTTASTGDVMFIRYNHNSHLSVFANINGTVNVTVTGDSTEKSFYFVRSNNPSTTQLTVGETAKIRISLPEGRQTSGKSWFISSVGGNSTNNKLTVYASAISENGALALGGVNLYTAYYNNSHFDTHIIADDTALEDVLKAWLAKDTNSSELLPTIKYRVEFGGKYHYYNVIGTAGAAASANDSSVVTLYTYSTDVFATVEDAIAAGATLMLGEASTEGKFGVNYFFDLASLYVYATEQGMTEIDVYVLADVELRGGIVIDGVTVNVSVLEGKTATVTSSAARLFQLTNGAVLTIDGLTINSTKESTTVATVGTFIAFDDETATAKSTVTLNNVTLTAVGIPFYFGGASVADVEIVGGSYTAYGMFAFGIAYGDMNDNAGKDIYFSGTANVTVTGTAEKHVVLERTAKGGDTRSIIFVNAETSVAESVNVVFDYVDISSTSHTIYLRGKGTLNLEYSNGTAEAAGWLIGTQGSSVPYMSFTDVDFIGTSKDHVMRPYSGVDGAYIKFVGGSITANSVNGSNPILNFNAKMNVSFEGVTFNSASVKPLIGGTATSYMVTDCTFNIAGDLLAAATLPVVFMGTNMINDTELTEENAADFGLTFAVRVVVDDAIGYATTVAVSLVAIPDGGEGEIQFYKAATSASAITIANKTVTFVGEEIEEGAYHLNFTITTGYAITLTDKATVTFIDMNVFAGRPLFLLSSTAREDLETEDRDVTLSFQNTTASGGSSSSVFLATNNAATDCDTFTLNVDESSVLTFNPASTDPSRFFNMSFALFANFVANINGTLNVTDSCNEARPVYFFRNAGCESFEVNVGETAKILFTGTQETTYALFEVAAGKNISASINIYALLNDDSALAVDNLYLFAAPAIPSIDIWGYEWDFDGTELQLGLMRWAAMLGEFETETIIYRVIDLDGIYHYYTSEADAQAAAEANGTTVTDLRLLDPANMIPDAETAIEKGLFFRLGDEVEEGIIGVHYFKTMDELMAYATQMAMDEIKICVLQSCALDPMTFSGKKVSIEGYDSDVTITKAGEIDGTTYNKVDAYLFSVGSNTTLTFKNITVKSVRIINITANEAGKTVVITLDAGTTFEALPNKSVYVDANDKMIDAGLIYKSTSNVDVTINVNAGATMLVPATETVNNTLVFLNNGAKGTLNVYGTMQNLANVAEGNSAQVYVVKGACNAFFNVYDGAVIEGTSSKTTYTGTHGGNYCGIVYYSAATLNGINIQGGTITVHGRTGLAYTGTKCNITVSGNAVINNAEAEYAMFYGASQTVTLTGTDAAKPTFNTSAKLLGSGTATAVNAFTDEGYKTTAKTLGFGFLLASNNTAYTTWSAVASSLAAEDTLYLLNNATQNSTLGKDGNATDKFCKKLHLTSYGDTVYTLTVSSYVAYMGPDSEIKYTDINLALNSRFGRIDGPSTVIFGAGTTVTHKDAIFIWNNGNNYISGADTTDTSDDVRFENMAYTIDIQKGAVITSTGSTGNGFIYHNSASAAGANVTVKIAGKLNITTTAPVTKDVNNNGAYHIIYDASSAELTSGASTYFVGGTTLTILGLEGAEADAKAAALGMPLYHNGKYYATLDKAIAAIPEGGEGTIRFFTTVNAASAVTIANKNVTFVGDTIAQGAHHLNFTITSGYAIVINDKATVTFQNMDVYAGRPILQYGSTARTDIAQADRDITLNFVNSTVSGGSSSSIFFGVGSTAGTGDMLTVNVDADSKLIFHPVSDSTSAFFDIRATAFANATLNIAGTLEMTDVCPKARPAYIFRNYVSGTYTLNITETAKINFTGVEGYTYALFDIAATSAVSATIHINAITNEGALALDDIYLYVASDVPGIEIVAPNTISEDMQTALMNWKGDLSGNEAKAIVYRVEFGGNYHYYTLKADATAAAEANGTTVTDLRTLDPDNFLADVNAAIAAGAYFRLGGDVTNGVLGIHYFTDLPALMAYAAEQGMTELNVYVLQSTAIDPVNVSGIKLTMEGYISGITLTKKGEFDGTSYARIDEYLFNVGANSTLVFKYLTVKSVRIVEITASTADTTVEITLDEGAVLEALPNKSVYVDADGKMIDAGLIYKGTARVDVTINVNAGATMLVPATETINNTLIYLNNCANAEINIYGKLLNLATVGEGKNAQIISTKQSSKPVVNIYDGAEIEGTSDSITYTGNYSGIIYFSASTNVLNVYGGTITIHGRTGFAYVGGTSTVKISGGTINNTEAEYAMFFGGTFTVTLTGTDTVKPTINTPAKLSSGGTVTAVNAFTDEGYKTVAKTLGFTVLLASNNTAYTTPGTARDAAAAEDTLYLLNSFTVNTGFAASFFTNRKLTITSYGDAKYTWTTSNGAAGVLFYLGNNSHLVIDNVIMNVGCRILRFESDGDVGGYTKLDIMGGAEIYALPAGDGNFFYYSANRVLTMNIEEGAIIQRKGDDTHTTSHLINLGDSFAAGSVINIKGKLSDISNFTATSGTRSGNLFYVGTANVTVNVYATAELEAAATNTTTSRFRPNGAVYFKGFEEGTDYDALAKSYGCLVRASETADENTAYSLSVATAINTIPAGGTGVIYLADTYTFSSEIVLSNKNVTITGADLNYTGTGYAFRVDNLATLTFKDLEITTSGGLVRYQGVASAIAKADRDIVINLVNTTVTANGAATYLIASMAHHGDTSSTAADQKKECDSITVNVDADSVIDFTTTTTGEVKFIRFDHNTHTQGYVNINGTVNVTLTGDSETAYFYFVRSNNLGTTQVTINETADVNITLPEKRAASGHSWFTSNTGGNPASNKITIYADAVTENGALTLGGVNFYDAYYVTSAFDVQIIASDRTAEEAYKALVARHGNGTELIQPVIYRVEAAGKFHYFNEYDTALEVAQANNSTVQTMYVYSNEVLSDVAAAIAAGATLRLGAETTEGKMGVNYFFDIATLYDYAVEQGMTEIDIYVLCDVDFQAGIVMNGTTVNLSVLEGKTATVTSSASRLFTLTNGAKLTIDGVTINSTRASNTVDTVGTFVTFDDATATAKSTVTLNNVTLTASGVPFYFGGASVADVAITGGSYKAAGMFAFGIASGDMTDNSGTDIYFSGTANVTVTGTADKHVTLTKTSASGDTRSIIFANASSSVKDAIQVSFNYVDVDVSGHATYLRNKAAVTFNYSNGTLKSSSWVIGSQGSAMPYVTYTNVAITGTSTDHIMRPYSGAEGAYIKFVGGSITANSVKGSNPILNFNGKLTITFDGVTFNSTSAKPLIGGAAPSFTANNCTFNVTGAIMSASTLPLVVTGTTVINGVTLTDANAATYGFAARVAVDGGVAGYVPAAATALAAIPTGGTGEVYLLATWNVTAEIAIVDKNVTLIGTNITADYHITASKYFSIHSKGTLTFKDLKISATAQLVDFNANTKVAGEQADKDAVINFVNTDVVANGSMTLLISSRNHYAANRGGCGEQANEVFVNVDKDSTIDFTTSSTSTVYVIAFNHNSHPYAYANIDGTVTVKLTGDHASNEFRFVRSNNPSRTTLNITETASLTISLPTSRATSGKSALIDATTGSKNTLNIHANAIIKDGALTTGGALMYYATSAGIAYQTTITAADASTMDVLLGWKAYHISAQQNTLVYRSASTNGTNCYSSVFVNVVDGIVEEGTVYLSADVSFSNFGNDSVKFTKKVHFTSATSTPITITTTGAIPFYIGKGAEIKFTNVTLNLKDRFARMDGNATVIFGEGCVVNHNSTIFIYDNGNAKDADGKHYTDLAYTIDIQAGATINALTKISNGLIYKNDTTAPAAHITVKIAGTINMPVATYIVNDTTKMSTCTIYYDATTANVTVGQDVWFTNTLCTAGSAVYAKGFANAEAANDWALARLSFANHVEPRVDNGAEWTYSFAVIAEVSEGLEFTTNGDGTCYVSGLGDCKDTAIVVPATSPAGDTVTGVAAKAFENETTIVSILLPATVDSIGEDAFAGCTALTRVYFGGNVVEWDSVAVGFGNELLTKEIVHFMGYHGAVSAWVTETAPSCRKEGVEARQCACGATEYRSVPASGNHVAADHWTIVQMPTATAAGTSAKLCLGCGMTMESAANYLAADGTVVLEKTVSVDLNDYAVIYKPVAGDATFTEHLDRLCAAMGVATGKTVEAQTYAAAATAKEILIGLTNRKESQEAYATLSGTAFTVRVVGDKIVIIGTNDMMTMTALQYFLNYYLNGAAEITMNVDVTAHGLANNVLVGQSGSDFAFVSDNDLDRDPLHMYVGTGDGDVSGDGRDYPVFLLEELLAQLSKRTGFGTSNFLSVTDTNNAYLNSFEVLFGEVDRAESRAFRDMLAANEYGYAIWGKKVIITAHTDAGLEKAMNAFLSFYDYILANNNGFLPQGYTFIGAVTDKGWITDFPEPDDVTIKNAQNNNNSSIQVIYTGNGANVNGFLAYCQKLVAAGYTLVQANDNVGNTGNYFRFYLNSESGHALYVAYNAFAAQGDYADNFAAEESANKQFGDFIHYSMPDDKNVYYPMYAYEQCIRVVSAPVATAYLPTTELLSQQSYNKITASSITTVRYVGGSVGMCYILLLEDGTFVIVDGGNNIAENKDKEILYAVLTELHTRAHGAAPSELKPIHIKAWLVTHSHGDHYTNMTDFLKEYVPTKLIKMDYLLGNFPERSTIYPVGGDTVTMGGSRIPTLQGYFTSAGLNAFQFVKVHTGMTLYFANLKMEILMTTEDHAPNRINNSNDTNTVTKWTISSTSATTGSISASTAASAKKTTWTLLGDSCLYQSRWLCAMWGGNYNSSTTLYDGGYLKSDMVQLAHHGNIGCEVALYKTVQPEVVWFPNKGNSYNDYTQNGADIWARHVDSYVANTLPSVKYIVVSGRENGSFYIHHDSVTVSFNANGIYFPTSNPAWGIKYDKTNGTWTSSNIGYNDDMKIDGSAGTPIVKTGRGTTACEHTTTVLTGKAPTCTATGLTEGLKCTKCSKVLVAQLELPALGHSYSAWTTTTAATCKVAGAKQRTCATCGATETATIPTTSGTHTLAGWVVADGYMTQSCTACGKVINTEILPEANVQLLYTVSGGKVTITGYNATGSKALSIPATLAGYPVTKIATGAFRNATYFTSISLPTSITEIEAGAFDGCSVLTKSGSFTMLGNWLIVADPYLVSVEVPNTVKGIANGAFADCNKLVQITNLSGLTLKGLPANLGQEIRTSTSTAFQNTLTTSNGFTTIKIGSTVYLINYTGTATTLNLAGQSFTALYPYALAGNKTIKTLSIPESFTNIGINAFLDCAVETLTATVEGASCVYYKTLKSLTLIGAPVEIPSYFMAGCDTLQTLVIPNTVRVVRKGAFEGCANVTSVTAPAEALSVGRNFKALVTLVVNGGSVIPAQACYDNTALKQVTIAASVTEIKGQAFYKSPVLEKVTFESGSLLTKLGANTFCAAPKLTSITLPEGLLEIGAQCFSGCSALSTVVLPSTVTNIAYQAFNNCTSLTAITIPASVVTLGQYGGDTNARGVFQGCTALKTVTFASGSKLELIGNNCFQGCTALTSITIPASVKAIGKGAFVDSGVTSVTFAGTSNWKSYEITSHKTQVTTDGFQNLGTGTAVTVTDAAANATALKANKTHVWKRG